MATAASVQRISTLFNAARLCLSYPSSLMRNEVANECFQPLYVLPPLNHLRVSFIAFLCVQSVGVEVGYFEPACGVQNEP